MFKSAEGIWYLCNYTDVKFLLTDQRFKKQTPGMIACFECDREDLNAFQTMVSNWILFTDPPTHTKIRKRLTPLFKKNAIDNLQTTIARISAELIDGLSEEFDLVDDYAYPLTVKVICNLLNVPENDSDLFQSWASEITKVLDNGDAKEAENAQWVVNEMRQYFRKIFQEADCQFSPQWVHFVFT